MKCILDSSNDLKRVVIMCGIAGFCFVFQKCINMEKYTGNMFQVLSVSSSEVNLLKREHVIAFQITRFG